MMVISAEINNEEEHEYQSKNAIIKVAEAAAILAPDDPDKAIEMFESLLQEIARIKYYPPKFPRPHQPRVNKSPVKKWRVSKATKSNIP
jgi:hypothetical protein